MACAWAGHANDTEINEPPRLAYNLCLDEISVPCILFKIQSVGSRHAEYVVWGLWSITK